MRKRPSWIGSDYRRRAKARAALEAAVNIIDHPEDGDVEGREELTHPSEFPARPIPSDPEGAAETSYHRPRQAEIGQELTQLTTEREHGKQKQNITEPARWNESYTDENRFEDADGKLGEVDDSNSSLSEAVYPPYTDGIGQPNPRYEDPDYRKHKIVLHASETEKIHPNHGPDYIWIAVDLDGTVLESPPDHIYESDVGEHIFGNPIPGAKEALQEMIDSGAVVSIYTARQYFADGEDKENKLTEAVEKTLVDHGIPFTDIYIGKKPPAHHFIDDKGISFDGDWSMVLDAIRDTLSNKREANDPVKSKRNYKGIDIDIEWPRGSIRSYKGSDTYATHMKCDYGYTAGITGSDGEELDIYLGPDDTDTAFIIEQMKEDGSYDEDKVMLGFASEDDAIEMYLQHMPAYMLGEIRAVPIDTLYNALYGEPEDRRGQDDQVPSEEKKTAEDKAKKHKKKKPVKQTSDYVGPQSAQVGGIGGVAADSDIEAGKQDLAQLLLERLDDPQIVQLLSNPSYNLPIDQINSDQDYFQLADAISRRLYLDPDFQQQVEALIGPEPDTKFKVRTEDDQREIDLLPKGAPENKLEPLSTYEIYKWMTQEDINKELQQQQQMYEDVDSQIAYHEQELARLKQQKQDESGKFYQPSISEPAYRPGPSPILKPRSSGPEESTGVGRPKRSSLEATKTWPEDDIFDNEFTDGTEERENRDIPREDK